jgi:phytoene dehydrogenase-like protein
MKERYDYVAITSTSLMNRAQNRKNTKESIFLFVNTAFKNRAFWIKNKNKIENSLINAAQECIPCIKQHVKIQFSATPHTLYKWTLNYRGACYGLSDTVSQFANPNFSEKIAINNLFLAGHWSNKSSGITSVINSGRLTAERIISQF